MSSFQPLTYVSDRDKLLVHIGTEQFMSSITFQIKQQRPNDDKVFHMRNVHYWFNTFCLENTLKYSLDTVTSIKNMANKLCNTKCNSRHFYTMRE